MVSICSLSFSTYTNFSCFFLECLQLIGQDVGEKGTSKDSSFNQVIRIKAVHFLAFFVLFYVGVEVTIGGKIYAICFYNLSPKNLGWVVTFMLDVRDGGPTTGYISSGFFGGMFPSPSLVSIFLLTCKKVWCLVVYSCSGSTKRCITLHPHHSQSADWISHS